MIGTGKSPADSDYVQYLVQYFVAPFVGTLALLFIFCCVFICVRKSKIVSSLTWMGLLVATYASTSLILTIRLKPLLSSVDTNFDQALDYLDVMSAQLMNISNELKFEAFHDACVFNKSKDPLNKFRNVIGGGMVSVPQCSDIDDQPNAIPDVCTQNTPPNSPLLNISQMSKLITIACNTVDKEIGEIVTGLVFYATIMLNSWNEQILSYYTQSSKDEYDSWRSYMINMGNYLQTTTYVYAFVAVIITTCAVQVSSNLRKNYSRNLHALAIVLSLVGFSLAFINLFLSIAVADICQNPDKIIDAFANDTNLNFYINCDPNVLKFPPILENMVDFIVNPSEQSGFLIDAAVGACAIANTCCNCDRLARGLEGIVGRGLHTFACTVPHNLIENTINAVCATWEPMFSSFFYLFWISLHILFMFFFIPVEIDSGVPKKSTLLPDITKPTAFTPLNTESKV